MKYGFMVSKQTCKNSTDCGIMSKSLGEIINLAYDRSCNHNKILDTIILTARKALLDSGHSIAKLKIEDIK